MVVRSIKHAKLVLERFLVSLKAPWIVIDCETIPNPDFKGDKRSTLTHGRHQINIFSIAYRGESYSFPTSTFDVIYPSVYEYTSLFQKYFRRYKKTVAVMHNANYDVRAFFFSEFTQLRKAQFWDTMISSWMADANEDKSLKARAPLYGRFQKDTKTIDFSDLNALAEYAEDDVIITDEIYQQHKIGKVVRPGTLTYIKSNGKLVNLKNEFIGELELKIPTEKLYPFDKVFLKVQEFNALRSTIDAEFRGVPFNRAGIRGIRSKMEKDLITHKKAIYRFAGTAFNLNSSKQKVEVLEELGLNLTKKTKSGAASVGAEAMVDLVGQHPIINSMMEYTKIEKLRSVYIGEDGLEYYINKSTDRIHCNLNTVGAVTGRYSSSCPNLQQIPSRNDRYGIKGCFEAPKGKAIVCMDFSQIELRVMAILSEDPLMTQVLNQIDGDIHTMTAEKLDVPRDPVAKQCNFLLIFGGGAKALQQRLKMEGHNVTEEECQMYIDGFNSTYYRVKEFREEAFEFHRQNGFIPLLSGRRRVIEDIESTNRYKRHQAETQLANNVVQGSAQDLAKNLIIRIDYNRMNIDRYVAGLNPERLRNHPKLPRNFSAISRRHQKLLQDYASEVDKCRKVFKLAKNEWLLQVHDEVLCMCDEKAAPEVASRIANLMTFLPCWQPVYNVGVAIRGDGGVGPDWKSAKKPKDKSLHFASPVTLWN